LFEPGQRKARISEDCPVHFIYFFVHFADSSVSLHRFPSQEEITAIEYMSCLLATSHFTSHWNIPNVATYKHTQTEASKPEDSNHGGVASFCDSRFLNRQLASSAFVKVRRLRGSILSKEN